MMNNDCRLKNGSFWLLVTHVLLLMFSKINCFSQASAFIVRIKQTNAQAPFFEPEHRAPKCLDK